MRKTTTNTKTTMIKSWFLDNCVAKIVSLAIAFAIWAIIESQVKPSGPIQEFKPGDGPSGGSSSLPVGEERQALATR